MRRSERLIKELEEETGKIIAIQHRAEKLRNAAHAQNDAALESALAVAKEDYDAKITSAQSAIGTFRQSHNENLSEIDREYRTRMDQALAAYKAKAVSIAEENGSAIQESDLIGADWQSDKWKTWAPFSTRGSSTNTRIGQLDEVGPWDTLSFPALIPFICSKSLLIKTASDGVPEAVGAVQSLLLRLLATIPPGKLHFTFIDPIGLGQNAAPFMQLVEHDEQLVTSRAWTQPHHIDQQMTDLTVRIEDVIQQYLRNEYASIEDYNAKAEVSEAYRVLVINDFPANFSEEAARNLVSIVQNGARCGVYAVILADTDKPLPRGFDLEDIARASTVIAWDGERHVWDDEDFRDCVLTLDLPPEQKLFSRIVKEVGEAARNADSVEVPFERIIPPEDEFWNGSAQTDLNVALGPSGASSLRYLELGKGTAQHALIAGKTGSGKSTLLHALITNLALTYSPEEVELYLIDFKKGVEFKVYAVHKLPHARVIAIESEREFGLSVLEGLDAELARRGDLFRSVNVDSLTAYRQQTQRKMPRILLLVDEFQEFFTEDDTVASRSSQILDRLVRQGRAFGIHIVLGSQTLAGAYSLARSTIDQMAVRIALQCSESDSRLILADDNDAARTLTRPGEAIYNDANGRFEGNKRFQVAWLSDAEREGYLRQMPDLARKHSDVAIQPQIVFEGNAPADIEKNQSLHKLLTASHWPAAENHVSAWLGEPVAIKEPTAAYMRRQSGSNLLVVGQSEEIAVGVLATALLSLAAQHPPQGAKFFILDFGAVDAPHAALFGNLSQQLPHPVQLGRRRQLNDFVAEIAAEVDRRTELLDSGEVPTNDMPSIYLCVYGLQRARDLRAEDDFSYSFDMEMSDEPAPPNPAQQFPTIIREGPEVGIHTLVWCDTVHNLERTIDRRAQREFEMRVAFQMGAEDAVSLIDTPAASKLGPYRALFVSDDEGRMEKFRPYTLPSDPWMSWVGQQIQAKL